MATEYKYKDILGFDDRKVMVFVIPLVGFSVPLLFFNETLSNGLWAYMPKFLISLLYTIVYWVSVRSIFIYIRLKFPSYKDTRKRILYTILLVTLAFFILSALLELVHMSLNDVGRTPGVTEFDYHVASFTIICLASSIYESVFFYDRWKKSMIEAERLRRENVESQLEGLRSQVNPHFLFNSLNTLIYIIPEDPQRAVRFVQMLSKVYRYILEIREKKLITLEEELKFLEAYVFLLKERFGENLRIQLNVPSSFDHFQIIPLSLQMLFENAIKHNIISAEKPLNIEVFIENQHLVVRNNLQKKKQVMSSTKVGLENIQHRYAFFSDNEVKIDESGAFFSVHLPLIPVSTAAPLAL
ncbi:MAG: histidine kinase [Saprospiraceae bacterium]|nr:histidine kinase [Saprospiraceae bacterium]